MSGSTYADSRPPGMSWRQYGYLSRHDPDALARICVTRAENTVPGRKAKWPDRCRHCNDPISKGDRVAWRVRQIRCARDLHDADRARTTRDAANARRRRRGSKPSTVNRTNGTDIF